MRRQFYLAMLSVVILAGLTPVRAQELKDTLALIPGEAIAFGVVNRLDQYSDKLTALGKKLHAPVPLSLDTAEKLLGVSIFKGVNRKGTAAVVFLPPADDGDPVTLMLLPVSSYEDFLGQFKAQPGGIVDITVGPKKFAVAGKGKHALLVQSEFKEHLKRALSAKKNMVGWSAPMREWLEDNDAAFVVTPTGIKKGTTAAVAGLAMAKDALAMVPDAAFAKGWIEGLETFLKTVETDVTHAGIGARIDQLGNITVDARGLFAKGGVLANGAAGMKTQPGGPLAGLPSGPYAMVLGGALPAEGMESLMKMNVEFIRLAAKQGGAKVPEDKLRKLEEIQTKMGKGIHGMTYLVRAGKGKNVLGGMMATMSVDDAAAYLENYGKSIPLLNEVYKDINLPTLPQGKVTKKTIGGVTILEVSMDLGAAAGAGDDPMVKAILEAVFGPGGKMTVSQAALDGKTVLTTFTNAQGLVQAMASIKKGGGLKNDAEVARTLKILPKGSQWVLLVNPRGALEMVTQITKAVALGAPPAIPEFPRTPPVGAAASLSETGLILQIVVPVEVLDGIAALPRQVSDR